MTSTANRREIFLTEMGIGPVWQRRDVGENLPVQEQAIPLTSKAEISHAPAVSSNADVVNMDWTQLREAVAGCTKCDLCHGRTQTVFGTGDVKA
ncbi:MAG: uracil-DNA glycosylase, partial [Burkholderiaceae bacterium]